MEPDCEENGQEEGLWEKSGRRIGKILLIILNPGQTEAETFVLSLCPECFS